MRPDLRRRPGSAGFRLAPCALQDNVTQTCISIALQLVSLTGKNFSFLLADGEQFCAFGINNTFVLAKADQSALDQQCNAQGFCKGVSAPIVLRAAPARSWDFVQEERYFLTGRTPAIRRSK